LLNKVLAKIDKNYDWIIAHNPGAFSPAAALAERRGSNLGIDVEDYHLGETTVLSQQKKIQAFMISTLNKAKYCSYAAPLIESFTQKLIPSFSGVSITLINSFEGIDFLLPQEAEPMTPLQLVWFSQNIDKGRGLEEVIPVINSLHKEVELHLVGNLTPSFNELYLKNKSGIVVHGPMFPQQVNLFLSRCDIGLAIDVPVNFNRQIALTNKIIAYAQAGLFIMATPTDAHRLFLESSKLEYIISDYTETSFSNCLKQLVANKEKLRKGKTERFRHGRQYDWEKKSNTLLSIWQQSKI
jgi:glycosyltransferase involved in cell wall biosynthesis